MKNERISPCLSSVFRSVRDKLVPGEIRRRCLEGGLYGPAHLRLIHSGNQFLCNRIESRCTGKSSINPSNGPSNDPSNADLAFLY